MLCSVQSLLSLINGLTLGCLLESEVGAMFFNRFVNYYQ